MKFDKNLVKNIDEKSARKILLKGGLIFDIICFLLLVSGTILMVFGEKSLGIPFIVVSVILFILGIRNLFLNAEKKERYLTSKLVAKAIKDEKKNGNNLSKEQIDKIKFEYDPIFHDKIVLKVHRQQDREYEQNVEKAENNVRNLEDLRLNEIEIINNERWQSVGDRNLLYNLIEGKININQTIYLFSSIKGAEVNKDDSYRIVTTETGKSKKHGSLGGAVAGGILLGPVGAVVGGSALGKTTSKGNSISNSIPTCRHIGVIVDIDGFKSEITLLDRIVDQSSSAYRKALRNAEEIVSELHYLSNQPVPKKFLKVEDEPSVLEIVKSIEEAQKELEKVKANKPTYQIPDRYLNTKNDPIKQCKKNSKSVIEKNEEDINKEKRKKEIQTYISIARYVLGIVICLISIFGISIKLSYGIVGIFLGLSIFPIVYYLLNKINILSKIIKNQIHTIIIQIIIPIFLLIIWIVLNPGEQLKYITFDDTTRTIAVGEQYEIQFKTNLSKIDYQDFKYISSDDKIASIENGIINAKESGKIVITISGKNGVKQSKEYLIKYVDIENITIEGDTDLLVGKTGQLKTTLTPKNASDNIIEWKSSNPEIISIDNDGKLIALAKGTVTISAISEKGKEQQIEVHSYNDVSSITASEDNIEIEKGKEKSLDLIIAPETASYDDLIFKSSNAEVASVENGKIIAKSTGTTEISAESINGVKTIINVKVYEIKPETITLNQSEISLSVGQTFNVNAIIYPENATDKSVSWFSSGYYSIASVENGLITAKGKGKATITAETANGKKATMEVKVTEQAPIKISTFKYTKDSVCGVEWNFSITNNSSKTINYVTLKWYNFNAVGDYVYDQIDRKNYTAVRYTGPLYPGSNSGVKRNSSKFYSCSYSASAFSEFVIEYADGTRETISASDMNYYTNLY